MSGRYEMVDVSTLDTRYRTLRLVRPQLVSTVRRSVERHGVLHPLVVNEREGQALVLLDGFKRLEALRELEQVQAPVRMVSLDEAAAQASMFTCNTAHRGLSELEEAWVVRSLVRKCKLRQLEVAELLDRHKSWVTRRLQLAERLDPAVQDDMRLGLVSATVARELVRLPRGNQAQVAQSVREHGITSRQSVELVDRALRYHGDPKALQALLRDPQHYLDAAAATPTNGPAPTSGDPRLSPRGEAVWSWLLRLDSASLGVRHSLDKHRPHTLACGELEVLAALAARVLPATREALALVDALLSAAGKDAPSDA